MATRGREWSIKSVVSFKLQLQVKKILNTLNEPFVVTGGGR